MASDQERTEERPNKPVVVAGDDVSAEATGEDLDAERTAAPDKESGKGSGDDSEPVAGDLGPDTTEVVSDDSAGGGRGDEIDAKLDRIESTLGDLKSAFDERLTYDRFKEQQIDRLHAELQTHKQDLIGKATRPLVNGVIKLHNDIGKLSDALLKKGDESLSLERVVGIIEGLQEDVEILLEQNGIERMEMIEEQFDPKLQTVIRKVLTPDASLDGLVADIQRPGFVASDGVVQKEKVAVYLFDESKIVEENDSESAEGQSADLSKESESGADNGEK